MRDVAKTNHAFCYYLFMKEFAEGFTVIDIETTGLSPGFDEIVELSAVRFVSFEPTESFSTLLKPRKGLKYQAFLINRISEKMVKDAPFIKDVAQEFRDFLADEIYIIGHNIRFDLGFLRHNGIVLENSNYKFYDTMHIAKKHITPGMVRNQQLQTLCKHFDIENQNTHRGLSDCIATGRLFCKLNDRYSPMFTVSDKNPFILK